LSDFWELTKPEIIFLIAITTAAGFWMAARASFSEFPWISFIRTLLGTVLVASGAATLNQFIEFRFDAQMRRTARRPLASGRIQPFHALALGVSVSFLGVLYLALSTNVLASLLAVLTLLSYLFLYTPLKRITPLCTAAGAIPGAVPPLIGWAAARGRLDAEAWLLWAIVFLWQFPHFMAIAWIYREDYARAGYKVLPAGDLRIRFITWQTVLASLALIPIGLMTATTAGSGLLCAGGTILLGAIFLGYAAFFAARRSNASAYRLLAASIVYLPLVFALLMLGKR
jgi:protoheme IX farnesyltransferase